ncbi:tyrosine-type recombinase/integrase [Kineosporia babensis]|uniref:Tyr recombinase domain-containing protein n=1 Tax=Kineosporia babensis TaxID=499548 RepID=A0A9X1NMM9_9ACTN|nr:hypothetical protein [Kineosporia babensis]MCD5317175.1 hypothetical protein [Kineosporia babensis]
MISFRVDIYQLEIRKDRAKPYGARWRVETSYKRRSFKTRGLAENFRSDLMQAARKGEGFDTETGLPESMTKKDEEVVTAYAIALAYTKMKWSGAAAKTRRGTAQALATVMPTLVPDGTPAYPAPDTLREALISYAFNPPRRDEDQPGEIAAALEWMRENSLPLEFLNDVAKRPDLVRGALDACAAKLDGKPAAAATMRRKRAVLFNYFGYAVERGHLTVNPVTTVQWKVEKVAEEVDRRVVLSPARFDHCLTGVTYCGHERGMKLRAFFALLFYASARPAEALALLESDLDLPEKGWGEVIFARSEPEAGSGWTDDGSANDSRGLKWRARSESRPVPIPPICVRVLRDHIARYKIAAGAPLFRTATGNRYTQKAYNVIWQEARGYGLPPKLAATPMGQRPYDLRHGGVTLWLNSGVPVPEVARRAGHSPDVLLKIYAGCIDDGTASANAKIERALGGDAPTEAGEKGDSAA